MPCSVDIFCLSLFKRKNYLASLDIPQSEDSNYMLAYRMFYITNIYIFK